MKKKHKFQEAISKWDVENSSHAKEGKLACKKLFKSSTVLHLVRKLSIKKCFFSGLTITMEE